MHCYGYIKNSDAEAPSELDEATIAADPGTLREIARFLTHVADLMDQHGDRFGHEHFEDFGKRREGECRLVVTRER
jgi:hypothetical protein